MFLKLGRGGFRDTLSFEVSKYVNTNISKYFVFVD